MFHTDSNSPIARPSRALVLDGDGASLSELAQALHHRGVTAVTAADGVAGLERLLDELLSLDVLVIALDLPQRDARELARLIRRQGNERDLALVVVADAPSAALRDELCALGVDALVPRAGGPRAVAEATVEAVRMRRELEEIERESWRHAPAAGPLGETTWPAISGGGGASMVA